MIKLMFVNWVGMKSARTKSQTLLGSLRGPASAKLLTKELSLSTFHVFVIRWEQEWVSKGYKKAISLYTAPYLRRIVCSPRSPVFALRENPDLGVSKTVPITWIWFLQLLGLVIHLLTAFVYPASTEVPVVGQTPWGSRARLQDIALSLVRPMGSVSPVLWPEDTPM